MSSELQKRFTVRLSEYGPEILADSFVRNFLLTSLKEVLHDSIVNMPLTDRDSIEAWLEVAKNQHVDSLSTPDSRDDETIDDLFGEFADLVLLEVLKQVFAQNGLSIEAVEEMAAEKHEEFADIEDLVRILANTSPALAATAALAFGIVDSGIFEQFAINRQDLKEDQNKQVFPPMSTVIAAYMKNLDKIADDDADLALAAENFEIVTQLLGGTEQPLELIDNASSKSMMLPRETTPYQGDSLMLLWHLLDPEQKERVRQAITTYSRGSRSISAHTDIEDAFDPISQGG